MVMIIPSNATITPKADHLIVFLPSSYSLNVLFGYLSEIYSLQIESK